MEECGNNYTNKNKRGMDEGETQPQRVRCLSNPFTDMTNHD